MNLKPFKVGSRLFFAKDTRELEKLASSYLGKTSLNTGQIPLDPVSSFTLKHPDNTVKFDERFKYHHHSGGVDITGTFANFAALYGEGYFANEDGQIEEE